MSRPATEPDSAGMGQAAVRSRAAASAPRNGAKPGPSVHPRLILLTGLAMSIGCLFGGLETRLGHPIWPTLVGLLAVLVSAKLLIGRWLADPMNELLGEVRRAIRAQRAIPGDIPAVDRRDELGELARMVQELSVLAYRHRAAADTLRRTMDERVRQATQQATRQLQEMAMRDALTSLGNRRFLDAAADTLIQTCRTAGADLVCIAIDMDHFKQVNDTLGHGVGDKLLQLVGQLLRSNTRRDDLAIRLGGDEFLILMPGCSVARAGEFARHITTVFGQHVRTVLPADLNVGLSTGVASMQRENAADAAALIAAADKNLYEAKHRGKGQTVGA